jgi:PleD family two-component response regulator
MPGEFDKRRLLIAASPSEGALARQLLLGSVQDAWDVATAYSIAHARFLLHHEPCDVLLVEEALYRQEGPAALDWLTSQREAPVVFLAGSGPQAVTEALQRGVEHWLPRDLAAAQPAIFRATLEQVVRASELRRRLRRAADALQDCRQQVSRLVNLLWESSAPEASGPWLPQRYMLVRLHEEIARSERQGAPFAIALGEIRPAPAEDVPPPDPERLVAWTAQQVLRVKRRADVAGRYGPQGFMLLLVQTPEPNAVLGCQRLRQAMEQAAGSLADTPLTVYVHMGVVGYSAEVNSPKSLLSCAERRLEQAKALPQSCLVYQ